MRRLIFVRHAESDHHIQGLMGGWTDAAITSKGREQAARTADVLATLIEDRTTLLTSDLTRASQTAKIIASRCELTSEPTPFLREVNLGDANGVTKAEAASMKYPEAGLVYCAVHFVLFILQESIHCTLLVVISLLWEWWLSLVGVVIRNTCRFHAVMFQLCRTGGV